MMRKILAIVVWCCGNVLADSARETATAAIDARLNGRTLDIFKTIDHRATNYVRSVSCWASAYDLSCIAAYNSYGMSASTNPSSAFESPTRRAGTLISPRHLIYADHYQIPHGTELRFVAPNNTHVSRVLTNSMRIPGTDLHVGVLDANVPTNVIGFAKVLPADFADSLAGIPALGLNQFEQALVVDIAGIRPDHWIQFAIPADPARKQFYRDKISGDSGQPAFLILHGQLVILTVWTGGGPGSGYFIPSYANQINAAMQSLGGHHQLTTVDFTEVSRVSVPQ